MGQDGWHFVVTDQRLGDRLERGTPSHRPYLLSRYGTWVHQDDISYILSLERESCCGKGMVKPAYHLAVPSAEDMEMKPSA